MRHDAFVTMIKHTGLNYLNSNMYINDKTRANEQLFIVSLHTGTRIQCGLIALDPLEVVGMSVQQAQNKIDLCKKRLVKEAG